SRNDWCPLLAAEICDLRYIAGSEEVRGPSPGVAGLIALADDARCSEEGRVEAAADAVRHLVDRDRDGAIALILHVRERFSWFMGRPIITCLPPVVELMCWDGA